MSGAKWTNEQLETAFAGFLSMESLKGLKRSGLKEVQVITRSDLLKTLRSLVTDQSASSDSKDKGKDKNPLNRRIELLLIEIERLRREKSDLEHQRGLVETERSDLRGKLDAIGAAGTKATGKKTTADDIRKLIESLEASRQEVSELTTQRDIARSRYEEQITGLRVKVAGLEQERSELESSSKSALQEGETLKEELEVSRSATTTHAQAKSELERKVLELSEQLAARDKELDELKSPPEPETPEGEAPQDDGASAPRSGTRRMRRAGRAALPRRSPQSGSYGFNFNSSRATDSNNSSSRRKRLGQKH